MSLAAEGAPSATRRLLRLQMHGPARKESIVFEHVAGVVTSPDLDLAGPVLRGRGDWVTLWSRRHGRFCSFRGKNIQKDPVLQRPGTGPLVPRSACLLGSDLLLTFTDSGELWRGQDGSGNLSLWPAASTGRVGTARCGAPPAPRRAGRF